MSGELRIFIAKNQPLTRFKWYGMRRWSGFASTDTTHHCHCCGRRRAAKNLVIQSYADSRLDRVLCAEGCSA